MVRAYLEFTYLIRHPIQTEDTLARCQAALTEYHEHREFLRTSGVRPEGFSIPRQHSHNHAPHHTWNFGALHGLCTSITENKHIKAVKEPWRRSNRYEALGQMLLTNQRLDKVAAMRVDLQARGMLKGSCYSAALLAFLSSIESEAPREDAEQVGHNDVAGQAADAPGHDEEAYSQVADDPGNDEQAGAASELSNQGDADQEDEGIDLGEEEEEEGIVEGPTLEAYVELARRTGESVHRWRSITILMSQLAPGYPRTLEALGLHLGRHDLTHRVALFLAAQYGLNPSDASTDLTPFTKPFMRVRVHHSAVATYHAPGDPSGIGGMRREHIRATPSWRSGAARYDCVFVSKDPTQLGFRGLYAARVRLFLSFKFESKPYECALVEWYVPVAEEPDEDTGMWVVEPEFNDDGVSRPYEVIHIDTIYRAAHLIGYYGEYFVPLALRASDSLDAFEAFFVNSLIDYHAHEHL